MTYGERDKMPQCVNNSSESQSTHSVHVAHKFTVLFENN